MRKGPWDPLLCFEVACRLRTSLRSTTTHSTHMFGQQHFAICPLSLHLVHGPKHAVSPEVACAPTRKDCTSAVGRGQYPANRGRWNDVTRPCNNSYQHFQLQPSPMRAYDRSAVSQNLSRRKVSLSPQLPQSYLQHFAARSTIHTPILHADTNNTGTVYRSVDVMNCTLAVLPQLCVALAIVNPFVNRLLQFADRNEEPALALSWSVRTGGSVQGVQGSLLRRDCWRDLHG